MEYMVLQEQWVSEIHIYGGRISSTLWLTNVFQFVVNIYPPRFLQRVWKDLSSQNRDSLRLYIPQKYLVPESLLESSLLGPGVPACLERCTMLRPHGWDASWEISRYLVGNSFAAAVMSSFWDLRPETQCLVITISQG